VDCIQFTMSSLASPHGACHCSLLLAHVPVGPRADLFKRTANSLSRLAPISSSYLSSHPLLFPNDMLASVLLSALAASLVTAAPSALEVSSSALLTVSTVRPRPLSSPRPGTLDGVLPTPLYPALIGRSTVSSTGPSRMSRLPLFI
jgi:hypothetical protein